jgi:hypothetical protein
MQTKLDFLVIGAQKCATSWLYYCLKEHPEILLPDDKAERAYLGGEMYVKNGTQWYLNRYTEKSENRKRGDISVDYMYDENTPKNLEAYVDKPKFIASLRHPTDRLISSYYWLVRKGHLPNLPIEEGIKPLLDQKPGFPDSNIGLIYEAVNRGFYGEQLERFTKMYSTESLYVAAYENINEDGTTELRKIYNFIGVDSSYVPKSLNVRPKKNSYNPILLKMERLFSRKTLAGKALAKIANVSNQFLSNQSKEKKQEVLSPKIKIRITELYKPHIEKTFDLISSLPKGQAPSVKELTTLWNLKNF